MEVELEDYENGKPITVKTTTEVASKIKVFKAKKQYKEMVDLARSLPNTKQKYLLEANALMHLKSWQELSACCDKGLTFEEDSDLFNMKGKAVGKMGNFEGKVQYSQAAIALNPTNPAYYRNLGAAFYKLKNYGKAIESHDKAIDMEPKNSINYHNKGAALFRLEKYQQARVEFQKAIEHDRKQVLSFAWLGDTEKELGNLKEAKKHYERAYEISGSENYKTEKDKIDQQLNPEKYKGIKGFFNKLMN